MTIPDPLQTAALVAYAGAMLGIVLRTRWSRFMLAMTAATAVTGLWAAAVAAPDGLIPPISGWAEALRAALWAATLLLLFSRTLPGGRPSLRRSVARGALVHTVLGLPFIVAVTLGLPWGIAVYAHLALAVCVLLLVENVYRNTPEDARWHVNLVCIAVGALFAYDVFVYADAILFRRVSAALSGGRAVIAIVVAPLLVLAAWRERRWAPRVSLSRVAVFHTATLVSSGALLLGLAAAGELMRQTGAGWGDVAAITLPCVGVVAVVVLVTSGTARSRLRAMLVDHFFLHRFDYRREWLRCMETLSARDSYLPLATRAIRSVAGPVDSPGGLLFLLDPQTGEHRWSGSWNLPLPPDSVPATDPLVQAFGTGETVVRLDAWQGESVLSRQVRTLWLAVPLAHQSGLAGFVLLAPPRGPFKLDDDVFELLRILGREVAAIAVEARVSEALSQVREMHEYAKRFAFIAHDIKGISSQLSLLLANAEHHADNPEFQQDVLITVRSCAARIKGLIAHLNAPGAASAAPRVPTAAGDGTAADPVGLPTLPDARLPAVLAACVEGGAARFALDTRCPGLAVRMPAEDFDSVVMHILNNAVEASPPGGTVRIATRSDADRLLLDIIDEGPGMSPEFIRDVLFRPFGTSKPDGSGLGVFQARELLRRAGGDLTVASRPGAGTTVRLSLRLQHAAAAPSRLAAAP